MKTIIIVASVHHGNTRKLVDAIQKEFEIDVEDATQVKTKDLSGYDLIGFASGVYAGKYHQSIREFAKKNLPENKRIFFLSTTAMNKDFSKSMSDAIAGKNAEVAGVYFCRGYNTFGPFKLVGGTAKGHPDQTDVKNAVDFFRGLVEA